MRWVIALVYLLVLSASQVQAKAAEVLMDCTIKHQQIVKSKDGKAEVYTGFTDGFDVGDTMRLELSTHWGSDLYFEVADPNREEDDYTGILFNYASTLSDVRILNLTDANYKQLLFQIRSQDEPLKTEHDFIIVREDSVEVKQSGRKFMLKRYYKSDYEGVYVDFKTDELFAYVATFDCRNVKGEIEQVLAAFE